MSTETPEETLARIQKDHDAAAEHYHAASAVLERSSALLADALKGVRLARNEDINSKAREILDMHRCSGLTYNAATLELSYGDTSILELCGDTVTASDSDYSVEVSLNALRAFLLIQDLHDD